MGASPNSEYEARLMRDGAWARVSYQQTTALDFKTLLNAAHLNRVMNRDLKPLRVRELRIKLLRGGSLFISAQLPVA